MNSAVFAAAQACGGGQPCLRRAVRPGDHQVLESFMRRTVVQEHVVQVQQRMFLVPDRAVLVCLVDRDILVHMHAVAVGHDTLPDTSSHGSSPGFSPPAGPWGPAVRLGRPAGCSPSPGWGYSLTPWRIVLDQSGLPVVQTGTDISLLLIDILDCPEHRLPVRLLRLAPGLRIFGLSHHAGGPDRCPQRQQGEQVMTGVVALQHRGVVRNGRADQAILVVVQWSLMMNSAPLRMAA